jgi:branched-chain amino acid transport system permease protein
VEEEQGLRLIDQRKRRWREPPPLAAEWFFARRSFRPLERISSLDLDALTGCLASSACLVTQTTSGFIIGMLLFLVAVGLTLIFGVLKVVNFSHGAFYMFGAYFAMTAYQFTGSFALAMLCGAAGTALLGLVFERVFMSRVYGADVLMQLLVCYAFVLIFDDVVRMIWGRLTICS